MSKLAITKLKMWQLCLPLLVCANLAYVPKNFLGWIITLGFFLFVPGYLLLSLLKHGIKSRWEIASISLGLSLLLLMVGGLLLNSLHIFGLTQPLSTLNTFITLDVITLTLLAFNRNKLIELPKLRLLSRISTEQAIFAVALTILPFLAIGGAFRLNNGASNILTMILFAVIFIFFILLVWRKNLKPLYPYALFMIGLSILFSTSLRGWSISGHDIQHEFRVFQAASIHNFWNIASNPKGDTYNACLSITILPTILAKITTISAPYVFKVIFQIIFAFCLIPVYFFIKRVANARTALIGSLIFISFPAFVNDMPFLNRQEIAFVFFALLLLVTFINMARRPKTILTILCLLGLILSHYSSAYVAICLLLLAWSFFKLLSRKRSNSQPFILPVLNVSIIFIALLFTFLWNAQATSTTSGLKHTVTKTIQGLWGDSPEQSSAVSYGLFAPPTKSPPVVLNEYAGATRSELVHYVPSINLPETSIGKTISHIISVNSLNNTLRASSAKILQLLLLAGLVIFFVKKRQSMSVKETYYYALALSCLVLLIMITLLPQLSVDYGVVRLFQQTLIITAALIVLATEFLLGFLGRFKMYGVVTFFGLFFLDLSGFIPQLLGGYPPQLALNNSGTYYNIYYVHSGELLAADWIESVDKGEPVAINEYAQIRLEYVRINGPLTNPIFATKGYLYQDFSNKNNGLYASFLSGNVLTYTYSSPIETDGNLLYINHASRIYHGTK